MTALIGTLPIARTGGPLAGLLDELYRRQPQLAAAAQLFALAVVPCLLALLLDPRTTNDINVWIKPLKFLVSLSLYFATLAWCFGYLPARSKRSLAGGVVVWSAIGAGVYEIGWVALSAAHGVPSHFRLSPFAGIAGLLSLFLMLAIFVQGLMLARSPELRGQPVFRLALVLGALIASIATTYVAARLAMNAGGHWVGGVRSDAGSLPLLGWSRSGGDLRVAHFWALHAQQVLPLAGFWIARSGVANGRLAVLAVAAGWVALIACTHVQALRGIPFLG